MGGGRFDPGVYRSFVHTTAGKATEDVYGSRNLHKDLNPYGVKIRESRDSADNPRSTPLIVALDVTGSMGMLADVIAREGLGTLFTSILDRKIISDPHVMFMGVGDANYDSAPLQVSQFEADKRIIEQLTLIYLEHGGGGNSFESYNLPWYFVGAHVSHDSFEKRNKRGYLFTAGDEEAPQDLTKAQIKRFIGDTLERELSTDEILKIAQKTFDIYHVIIEEGDYAKSHLDRVVGTWTEMLGQRAIRLSDHRKLAETIVTAIEVAEGRDADEAVRTWTPETARIVHRAVKSLPMGGPPLLPGA